MKREEKNRQTRRRILDGALAEFARQGYGAGSVNTICAGQDISKGIVYHYFSTKDALYLACVEECFQRLTEHLQAGLTGETETGEARLEEYFTLRLAFFRANPVYQPIFCQAVLSPPAHLREEVRARKGDFDRLNARLLEDILSGLPLRPHITRAEVAETFGQFQDFINARYQTADLTPGEFEAREESCRRALNILLYGVIERKEDRHE